LQRRVSNFLVGYRRIEVEEGLDVSAHGYWPLVLHKHKHAESQLEIGILARLSFIMGVLCLFRLKFAPSVLKSLN
jgi:hypothetical protein